MQHSLSHHGLAFLRFWLLSPDPSRVESPSKINQLNERQTSVIVKRDLREFQRQLEQMLWQSQGEPRGGISS